MLETSKAFSGFSVDSLDMAQRFYEDRLGLEVARNEMGLALCIIGSRPIFIYQKDNHEPASYTVLNFPVNNIDEAVDALIQRGVVFIRQYSFPFEQDSKGISRGMSPGMGPDIAWFRDPAGNILSVIGTEI